MSPLGIFPSNSAVQQFQLAVFQANADRLYKEQTLPEYKVALDNWIQANVHSRELSADPSEYKPTAAPARPSRTVWFLDSSDVLQTRLEPDLSVAAAELPPFLPNQSTSIKSPAPPDPVQIMLMLIHQDLQSIKMKLGIV